MLFSVLSSIAFGIGWTVLIFFGVLLIVALFKLIRITPPYLLIRNLFRRPLTLQEIDKLRTMCDKVWVVGRLCIYYSKEMPITHKILWRRVKKT